MLFRRALRSEEGGDEVDSGHRREIDDIERMMGVSKRSEEVNVKIDRKESKKVMGKSEADQTEGQAF